MSTVPEIHERMRKASLDAYLEEYKQLKETWRSIETKAQGSIAVAGIFIAGALAFLTKMDSQMQRLDKVLLSVGIASLIVSVVVAIMVLRTQLTKLPPLGIVTGVYALGMVQVKSEADLELHVGAFFTDVEGRWRTIIGEVIKANESKANTLWWAQVFLIFAIVAVAGLSILKLII